MCISLEVRPRAGCLCCRPGVAFALQMTEESGPEPQGLLAAL